MNNPTREEAMAYLGVDEETLERITVEYELDAEVDDDGRILWVDGTRISHALFEEHRKAVGHAPDDPEHQAAVQKEIASKEAKAKRLRDKRRVLLTTRVKP